LSFGRSVPAAGSAEPRCRAGPGQPADHERLRGAGFDDRAILQITLIAAWFIDINRVADALGVGRS
jgi:alkylhydroperoxidase family enzyme